MSEYLFGYPDADDPWERLDVPLEGFPEECCCFVGVEQSGGDMFGLLSGLDGCFSSFAQVAGPVDVASTMMAEAVAPGRDGWEQAYAEAMRAEVDWAPLHFDGWAHYEQARPALLGETIEVIGRWADQGYTLRYRPLLGELTEARQFPIDPFPEVTVLGRIDDSDLSELRSLAAQGLVDDLSRWAAELAKTDRASVPEPPVRTGSTIPALAEIPVHYLPNGEAGGSRTAASSTQTTLPPPTPSRGTGSYGSIPRRAHSDRPPRFPATRDGRRPSDHRESC